MKAWIARQLKTLLDSVIFKNFVVEMLARSAGATSGFLGWFYKRIANWLFELGRKYGRRPVIKLETQEEVKVQLEKYDKVLNDPKSTPEDIRKAAADFWTS